MILSVERLQATAASTGFRADVLEKVAHLLGLLSSIQAYPQLMNKYALKGGTALNLFHFPVPRLSVDIDLNYIGQLEREAMLQDRIHAEQLLKRIYAAHDFQLVREPADTHAGGKWRLSYRSYTGQLGTIEVDLNYQFRQPLWPVTYHNSHPLGPWQAQDIPLFDMHELAGGKLAALFSRQTARDLFDVYQVLQLTHLDTQKLRQGFVLYGAMNRKDWRTITLDDLNIDPDEFEAQLVPLLRERTDDPLYHSGKRLLQECKDSLQFLFPFTEQEQRFLDLVLDRGVVDPTLITNDLTLQEHVRHHPALMWKALNVRQHHGHD